MPKSKVNPIVGMLNYFEDAPLTSLDDALALVKETIRRRKLDAGGNVRPSNPVVKKGKKKPNSAAPETIGEALAGFVDEP